MRNEAKLSYDIGLNLSQNDGLIYGCGEQPSTMSIAPPVSTTMTVVAAISNYAIMLRACSLTLDIIVVLSLAGKQIELRLKNLTAWLRMLIWRET